MPGPMTLDELTEAVAAGDIDTVLVCLVDMQGRLMGKRLHARHFLDTAGEDTHCCNYLLATDLEMATPDGYAATGWGKGYGDYAMRPDLDTLRPAPWLAGTAMVLCDVLDHQGAAPVAHSPRAVLKAQIARLATRGLAATMATELEFFLFEQSYAELASGGHRDLRPISAYNEDYHILQTSREETVMRPLRNHLYAAGIPVEGTKGEAEAGQEELNIRHADALACADHHTIAKHAVKEIAFAQGHAASFLAKWHPARSGSAAHVHLSLRRGGASAFYDPGAEHGMSALMRQFLAGMVAHAPEITVFLAPYVNSYKRFARGTFAPTRAVWSVDNRTSGFRLCGADTQSVRVECRIGGADLNPYLAQAALIAAGLAGIEADMALPPALSGNAYAEAGADDIPRSLAAATQALRGSDMLRAAMGVAVVDHYLRCAEVEQEAFDAAVTDWEIARGFERA